MYDSYIELRVAELIENEGMTHREAIKYVEEEIAHKEAQAEALYDASYEY